MKERGNLLLKHPIATVGGASSAFAVVSGDIKSAAIILGGLAAGKVAHKGIEVGMRRKQVIDQEKRRQRYIQELDENGLILLGISNKEFRSYPEIESEIMRRLIEMAPSEKAATVESINIFERRLDRLESESETTLAYLEREGIVISQNSGEIIKQEIGPNTYVHVNSKQYLLTEEGFGLDQRWESHRLGK